MSGLVGCRCPLPDVVAMLVLGISPAWSMGGGATREDMDIEWHVCEMGEHMRWRAC